MLFPYGIDFGSKEVGGTPKASSVIPLYAKADSSWMSTLPLDPSYNTTGSILT